VVGGHRLRDLLHGSEAYEIKTTGGRNGEGTRRLYFLKWTPN